MKLFNLLIGVAVIFVYSCSPHAIPQRTPITDSSVLRFHVSEANDWTNLFLRTSGWVGADGIFSIPLSGFINNEVEDTSTLFIFSDTILGEIENGKFLNGFNMINNSVAVLKGKEPLQQNIRFYWKKTADGKNQSVIVPKTNQTKTGDYYWLGDGFVNKAKYNNLYIFAYRIHNIKAEVFGFEEVGNALLVVPTGFKPPYDSIRQIETNLFIEKEGARIGSFGAGLLMNDSASGSLKPDDYLYVYGVVGNNKQVIAARVKPLEIENMKRWRFWNGKKWIGNKAKATPVADRASNELSVTPLPNGKFAMIFQIDCMSNTIGMRIGDSPVGPFGPIIKVWDCSADTKVNKSFFVYNAKAHPALSKKGELLISYNLNSFDSFNDLLASPNHYHPRFIKLVWEKNLTNKFIK